MRVPCTCSTKRSTPRHLRRRRRRTAAHPRALGDWRPFHLDVSAEPDPEQAARTALADLLRTPFDLERDLLFRLGVVKLAATRSLVVIAYHHLVSDGFGTGGAALEAPRRGVRHSPADGRYRSCRTLGRRVVRRRDRAVPTPRRSPRTPRSGATT
ncbi:condensation domain-containing protein [Streptomyces sp. KL116D]|uniref:condensation domain-containing protein n=1 Tax=Streptomyces sp. KL116D TaxID=3045152 RepID=UPI003558BFE9